MLKQNKRPHSPKHLLRKYLWATFALSFTAMALVLSITLLMALGRGALLHVERDDLRSPSEVVDIYEDEDLVIYNDKKYTFNENVTAILCIGVDKENFASEHQSTEEKGQADVLFLVTIDTKTGRTVVLPISRETMAEVEVYSNAGKPLGSSTLQICMAYAYGDGKAGSCENTVLAVSKALYGIPINSYYAIDINAVPKLNDRLGGVTVSALETMRLQTRSVKAGQSVILKGKNALAYVQRRGDDLNANNRRMQRQLQYFSAFAKKAGDMAKADITLLAKLYQTASRYSVNNITLANVTYLASSVLNNGAELEYKSIAGETKAGEKYIEFYPDQASLYETILNIYYRPYEGKKQK